MDGRQQRGLEIAQTNRIKRTGGGAWIVPSQSGPRSYVVRPEAGSCTCPDHELRGAVVMCKHRWAIAYVRHEVQHEDGTTVTTETLRVTYRQDWSRYNEAQRNEKAIVQELLCGLCEGIVQEPQTGRGRPRLPLADVVYGLTMKVYTGMSGRRASTDIEECGAKGQIDAVPAYNTLFTAMQRPDLTALLTSMIEASAAPLASIERDFSVDATGFSTTAYDRWFDKKWGREQKRQRWLKCHAMIGNETNIITAVAVTEGNDNDSPELPALVKSTAQRFQIAEVMGDKAYLSLANLAAIEAAGATPYVPFKINSSSHGNGKGPGSEAWRRMWLAFQLHREDFLSRYHRRSNVEATFSAIKRKFGASLRSKKPVSQTNELLAKVLCYNLSVVAHASTELGIDPRHGAIAVG